MRTAITFATLIALALAGCSGKKDEQPAAQTSKAGAAGDKGAAAKPAAALEWKKLDKLGLQIEMPADAEVMDTSADAANASIFNNDCKVNVSTVTPAYTDKYETAVAEVEKDPGTKFEKWTKQEKTADGWHLEWTCKSMFEDKILYGVEIRRTFGDKQIQCWEKLDSPEALACTLKACASLKPM